MKTITLFLTFTAFYLLRGISGGHSSSARNYQLDITDSGTYVYRGSIQVGFVPFDSTSAFDKLFLTDNL